MKNNVVTMAIAALLLVLAPVGEAATFVLLTFVIAI
jgi:hypothetical protein